MAVYPDLAKERFHQKNLALRKNCQISFQLIALISCFIIIPFIILRVEVVSILFGYGKMTDDNIHKIALAMLYLAGGVLFQNLINLVKKIFISYEWIGLLSLFSFAQFVIYTLICYLLIDKYSYLAIPVSFTLVKIIFFSFSLFDVYLSGAENGIYFL